MKTLFKIVLAAVAGWVIGLALAMGALLYYGRNT